MMNLLVMESGSQTLKFMIFLYGPGQAFPYELAFGVELDLWSISSHGISVRSIDPCYYASLSQY